jgi:hypothetical protein
MFPRSDAREFWGGGEGNTPMSLEESDVEEDDSGIQHSS